MARASPLAPSLALPAEWTRLIALIPALERVVIERQAAYREATTTYFRADHSRADEPLSGWDEPSGAIADWASLLAELCARGLAEAGCCRTPQAEPERIELAAEDWRMARFTRDGGLAHPLAPEPWREVVVRAGAAQVRRGVGASLPKQRKRVEDPSIKAWLIAHQQLPEGPALRDDVVAAAVADLKIPINTARRVFASLPDDLKRPRGRRKKSAR